MAAFALEKLLHQAEAYLDAGWLLRFSSKEFYTPCSLNICAQNLKTYNTL